MQKNNKALKNVMGGLATVGLAGAGFMAVAPAASADTGSDWDRLAECESGGDWSINTGNGYYGGLQFSQQSWEAVGGSGLPSEASKDEQIQRAEQLRQIQDWGAWPSCSAQLGLSGDPSGTPAAAEAEQQESAPAQQETQVETSQTENQEAAEQQAPVEESAPVEEQAPAPQKTGSQDVAASGETYTVQSGDTLSKISDAWGISDWNDLYQVNAEVVTDPALIYVGQELQIPAS
ncbi:MAG: transglycosylase family protein [Micrococcaceae bacterium]